MFLGLLFLGATVLVSSSYEYKFVKGPVNTASCADPNTVVSEDECHEAAAELEDGKVNYYDEFEEIPSGCSHGSGHLFYNTYVGGMAREDFGNICLRVPAKYVKGLVNTVCPYRSTIDSQAQCMEAAEELRLTPSDLVFGRPDYPICFYDMYEVTFNAKGSYSNEKASPICLRVPVPDPSCEGISCPASERCENGICIDPCARCGKNEQCIDGECVDTCKGTCRDFEHCEEGKCVDTKCQEVKCDELYQTCSDGKCFDKCKYGCGDEELKDEPQVCGSDGIQYENECYLDEANCKAKLEMKELITIKKTGPCEGRCGECRDFEHCDEGKCVVEGLKCNKCRSDKEEGCKDQSEWTEETCDHDEWCQYTTITDNLTKKVLEINMGCEEIENCEEGCRPLRRLPNATKCYQCCDTDFCNVGREVEPTEDSVEPTEESYIECLSKLLNGLYSQLSSYLDDLLQDM